MSIEETIRAIVTDELDKREHKKDLVPVSTFCKAHNLSRITVWRQERQGKLKVVRIGRKVFIQPNQF